jgi:hypothetical protein
MSSQEPSAPSEWWTPSEGGSELPSVRIDTSVAHPARRYDYWLGGKDNFEADRASGDAVAAAFPAIRTAVIENRRFLGRAVRFLAAEANVSQFLDIGTGIPAANNTHQVAQEINPAARIVYVDNDPIVLAHARALLTSNPEGVTSYIDADLRDPKTILNNPGLKILDLTQPVALMLVAVMHFVMDEDHPYDAVRSLIDALPDGSYVVMTHATNDYMPPQHLADTETVVRSQGGFRFRDRDEVARFFEGLELIPPGIVSSAEWRPDADGEPRPSAADTATHAVVAKINKPRP